MYGTRAAANSWAKEYTAKLLEWGFIRGRSNPCIFEHATRGLKVMVHGDDFVSLGIEEEVNWFHSQMEAAYEVKIRGVLGPEEGDDKKIEILNRIVEWGEDGIRYEGDPRHAEAIIKAMGGGGWKTCSGAGMQHEE